MNGSTHMIIGLAASAAASDWVGSTPDSPEILAVLIGSLAPDIDGRGSITRPGRYVKAGIGETAAGMIDSVLKKCSSTIQSVLGHRGMLHAPFFSALICSFGAFTGNAWIVWFGWGYFSHLAADYFTQRGIPVFGPISAKPYRGSSMKNDSKAETMVALFFTIYIAIWGWGILPPAAS